MAKFSILAGGIAVIVSLVVGSLIISGSSNIVYENALALLRYEANAKAVELLSDIQTLIEDVSYLASTSPVRAIPSIFLTARIGSIGNEEIDDWESRLAMIFSELVRAKPNYMQIRYIGLANDGMELLRVERKGAEVAVLQRSKLQKKGDTDYFQESTRRNPGEIYLSEITLNKEFGEISEPHMPVIRAARPVYFGGKLHGIVVINMALDVILDNLVRNTPRELTPYIANESGYFLAHPNKAMVFGFDLDNDYRVQTEYPGIDFSLSAERMKDITNMTFERLKVNDIKLEVKYHDISENTLIQCQSLQISQVLINLFNNAYDAALNSKDRWIKINLKKVADRIQISVADSGKGIPGEILDRIFEPMFTTKDIGSGTGLGLSISREIVLSHHGSLYLDESSPNTQFNLELPIVQSSF